jgi:hypothetical protein
MVTNATLKKNSTGWRVRDDLSFDYGCMTVSFLFDVSSFIVAGKKVYPSQNVRLAPWSAAGSRTPALQRAARTLADSASNFSDSGMKVPSP